MSLGERLQNSVFVLSDIMDIVVSCWVIFMAVISTILVFYTSIKLIIHFY